MLRNLLDNKEEVFLENENVRCGLFLTLSPDGKHLACVNFVKSKNFPVNKHNEEIAVISTENPNNIKFIPIYGSRRPLNFSPDGKAIIFVRIEEDRAKLMRQELDKQEPKQLSKTVIFNFAWSKDGKKLVLSQGQQLKDAVLITEFE
jgi:Tol biopolymer transport system component